MTDQFNKFPELFYVHSKITEPQKLSIDAFNHWYNDIHIPDILATSGVERAYRYHNISTDASSTDRPYLALYPIKSEGYLQSKEFAAIPVKSDVLPGPDHKIFDVADFDCRCYTWVGGRDTFEGPFLLMVQFDGEDGPRPEIYEPSVLLKCYFALQNETPAEKSEIGVPPTYLALVWYQTEEELNRAEEWSSKLGKVTKFKLMRAFPATAQSKY